jgi:alanyl-tRNA synthetase
MPSRAAAEPYVTEFETTVERVDGGVVLSESYFYPESGGQPADRGRIADHRVVDVQRVDGDVVHTLDAAPSLEPGDSVRGVVDADFRTYCARAHTASHVLYGAGRRLLDDLGYGGFGIGEEKIRVDLATSTDIDDDTLVEVEQLVNRAVWDSRDVTWEELPREEALSREAVAFNAKTEEGVAGEEVRIVEIDGWDVAACGGTHVRNTREIGPVTLLERSNPGEGLTRVEFAVGLAGIERRGAVASAARAAARELDTGPLDVDSAAARLVEERDRLADQVETLREQVVEARLAELRNATVTRDGREWLAGRVPTDDANALAEFAGELVDGSPAVAALVGENGGYVAVATDGSVDAGSVVDDVTTEFGGGGGGSPTVAQGGGLDADPEEVVAFLRGH